MSRNNVVLSGTLIGREVLRHTPAGMPALNFRISHASEQAEAGRARKVTLEMDAVALGEIAEKLNRMPVEGEYLFEGFLAMRSKMSRLPVLHVNSFELNRG